ncbi:MAG: hypothetical protein U1F42_08635 [Candidatus Competibacteraceae bacterium]
MRRTLLAFVAPPAAVTHYGCATVTAAPIGVFWLASLASLGYGAAAGASGSTLGGGELIAIGVLLWLVATAWARLVIGGVQSDLHHAGNSTHDHQVVPQLGDPDPLSQLQNSR